MSQDWTAWNVIHCGISGIAGIICLMILIIFIMQCYINRKSVQKQILLSSFFSIFSFTLSECIFVYISIKCKNDEKSDDPSIKWRILINLWAIFWNFGVISCFVLCLQRFHLTFITTQQYKPSFSTYIIMLILIGIYFLFSLLLGVRIGLIDNISDSVSDTLKLIYLCGAIPLALLITVSILAMFINKLKMLSQSIKQSGVFYQNSNLSSTVEMPSLSSQKKGINDDYQRMDSRGSKTNGNKRPHLDTIHSRSTTISFHENVIMDAMAKIFVVNTIIIVTTEIVLITTLITFIIGDVLDDKSKNLNSNVLRNIYYMTRNLDSVINTICIYISFKFNHKGYLCLCSCIQNCLVKYYASNMAQSLLITDSTIKDNNSLSKIQKITFESSNSDPIKRNNLS